MDGLELIKNTPSNELIKNHLKVVFKTYYELFGEVCTGCPTKITGYINRIKNYKKSNTMEKDNRNFKLKKGAILPVPGTSQTYSNENITDEIALAFIRKNPNRKALFAVLPKNINELIEGASETKEKTLGDYTKAELKALYPEATGKNKAELIASIQVAINKSNVAEETIEGASETKDLNTEAETAEE